MSWRQVASYIAHDCPEYLFELDEHKNDNGDQMLFVHLTVRVWSKSTMTKMLDVFKKFRECVVCPLYAVPTKDSKTYEAFIAYFGFHPLIQDVVCENGQHSRLYLNLKDQDNVRHDFYQRKHERKQDDQPVGSAG